MKRSTDCALPTTRCRTSRAFPAVGTGASGGDRSCLRAGRTGVSSARVLEIGCSAGGNLIPFAVWHPRARVVGIDLSQVQIDQGRRSVQGLGLRNLELLQGDIAAMDLQALGQFDYIICHGVYSWVPENVQEAILSAFARCWPPRVWRTSATTSTPGGRRRRSCATRCCCAVETGEPRRRNWAMRAA